MLDDDVIEYFRQVGELEGSGYQTKINAALRAAMSGTRGVKPADLPVTVAVLRKILREELGELR